VTTSVVRGRLTAKMTGTWQERGCFCQQPGACVCCSSTRRPFGKGALTYHAGQVLIYVACGPSCPGPRGGDECREEEREEDDRQTELGELKRLLGEGVVEHERESQQQRVGERQSGRKVGGRCPVQPALFPAGQARAAQQPGELYSSRRPRASYRRQIRERGERSMGS
jgi:hypothetical protein